MNFSIYLLSFVISILNVDFLLKNSKLIVIETDYIKVESSFELVESTKKKEVYDITFNVTNKIGQDLFYVANYIKSKEYIQEYNESKDQKLNDQDNIEVSAPPPLSTSEYVESGGAMKVGTGSVKSSGGRSNNIESKIDDGNSNAKEIFNYSLENNFFEIIIPPSKNLRFISDLEKTPNKAVFFNIREKKPHPIFFKNESDKRIQISDVENEFDPIVCIIPVQGLSKVSRLEISKKSGSKPADFEIVFSKNIVYSNKTKLLLDKTFHLSIEEAIMKYKELQKILNENI